MFLHIGSRKQLGKAHAPLTSVKYMLVVFASKPFQDCSSLGASCLCGQQGAERQGCPPQEDVLGLLVTSEACRQRSCHSLRPGAAVPHDDADLLQHTDPTLCPLSSKLCMLLGLAALLLKQQLLPQH